MFVLCCSTYVQVYICKCITELILYTTCQNKIIEYPMYLVHEFSLLHAKSPGCDGLLKCYYVYVCVCMCVCTCVYVVDDIYT